MLMQQKITANFDKWSEAGRFQASGQGPDLYINGPGIEKILTSPTRAMTSPGKERIYSSGYY